METPKPTATHGVRMPPVPNVIVLEREQRTISLKATAGVTPNRGITDTFDIEGVPIMPGVYRYERITQLTRIGD